VNRTTVKGSDGEFAAYIARPTALLAPVVVVLQELFGVNADIRKTCDELAAQGLITIAPHLFWRQEPGVDLEVTSEESWQHGLRLNTALDRDAVMRDIMETVRTAIELNQSSGKVALLGFCLGALMVFITAARCGVVDAAVAYHGADTKKYFTEVDGLRAPMLMQLGEEDELISKQAQAEIRAALAQKASVAVYIYPDRRHAFARHNGAHYNPGRRRLPMREPENFCTNS
jgi:carboxymethylenebutenolidase